MVIDNGSRDGTCEEIARHIPHARLIARQSNAGFGGANNEGFEQVGTRLALLINPDCHIDQNSVRSLLFCMSAHPNASMVAPQGWQNATTLQKSWRPAFYDKQPRGAYRLPADVTHADWLHGSCLLVRANAFRSVKGFDEQFFLYYEDDDLCLRMRRAGFDCLLEPAASSLHHGGRSSPTNYRTDFIKRFHYARSRQIAIRRYVGRNAANLHLARLLFAWLPATLFYTLMGRPRDVVKWLGWGTAASCAALSLDSIASRVR